MTLNELKEQYNALVSELETIDLASDEADIKLNEAEELKAQIETLEARQAKAQKHFTKYSGAPNVIKSASAKPMTAGEYLHNYFLNYRRNPDKFYEDAAYYFTMQTQATADNAALLPTEIVGSLIDFLNPARPTFASFAQSSMPGSGKTFERLYISQHTTVDAHTEGETLASQKFTVAADTVTKAVYGGTLTLTKENIEWSDPSALTLVLNDLVKVYGRKTEENAADFLEAASIEYAPVRVDTIPHAIEDLISACQFVDINTNGMAKANTVWCDPGTFADWAQLVNSTTDISGLALIRQALREYNHDLRFVSVRDWGNDATPSTGKVVVGDSSYVTAYEKSYGLVQADEISNLTRVIAVAGENAFHIVEEAFVSTLG